MLNYIDLHRGVIGLTLLKVEIGRIMEIYYYSLLQNRCAEKQMLEDFFD